MFPGPSAGGLVAGPTTGAINASPAAYIPDNGLTIAQISELRGELAQKHRLLTESAPLAQNLVTGLPGDIAAKANAAVTTAALATKADLAQTTAALATKADAA